MKGHRRLLWRARSLYFSPRSPIPPHTFISPTSMRNRVSGERAENDVGPPLSSSPPLSIYPSLSPLSTPPTNDPIITLPLHCTYCTHALHTPYDTPYCTVRTHTHKSSTTHPSLPPSLSPFPLPFLNRTALVPPPKPLPTFPLPLSLPPSLLSFLSRSPTITLQQQ